MIDPSDEDLRELEKEVARPKKKRSRLEKMLREANGEGPLEILVNNFKREDDYPPLNPVDRLEEQKQFIENLK